MRIFIVFLFTVLSVCLLAGIVTEATRAQPLQSQMAQKAPIPERRRVVPMEVIERFKLKPTEGTFAPYVLGYDGRPYLLDDVLDAVFELTAEHWRSKK